MAFDFTVTPATFGGRWPGVWSYGTGRADTSTGFVSARSSSGIATSNFDGAGVGFLLDITTERTIFVTARLRGFASSEAVSMWGYASAEPMFDLWLFGFDAATRHIVGNYQVGIGMRAVAPVVGWVQILNQTRMVEPALPVNPPLPLRSGRLFAGIGVKTYAGSGFLSGSNAYIESRIDAIRVSGW